MNKKKPEQSSRDEIREIQNSKLTIMLNEVVPQNQFWTNRFSQWGIKPQEIRTVEDLAQIPVTTKADLIADIAEAPPYGTNLTYPLKSYSRYHQTSGTTGEPMPWLDTPQSWAWFMECWRQIYEIAGLTDDDRLFFPFSFGPFIGFWAAFDAAHHQNRFCIPAGGMSTTARIQMLMKHNVTIVCCTPTYALRMVEVAKNFDVDLSASAVRLLIVAGEPGGSIPATRQQIEQGWGARVFDHWGMTDIGSLGMESIEDPSSLLILETECIAEIVDPKTLLPTPKGEQGELIITNLGRLGMPLFRYRTGDLVQAGTTPNQCGKSLLRLDGGILGRSDDMITIRGNNVFPSSLEAVLRGFSEVAEYRATVTTQQGMHQIAIEIEAVPAVYHTGETAKNQLLQKCKHAIKDRLSFHPEIVLVEQESLPRFEMKARRFFHNKNES